MQNHRFEHAAYALRHKHTQAIYKTVRAKELRCCSSEFELNVGMCWCMARVVEASCEQATTAANPTRPPINCNKEVPNTGYVRCAVYVQTSHACK